MMKNPLKPFLDLSKEEKRYWVPVLITVGAAVCFLGLSLINIEGISAWAGWVDIVIGLGAIYLGVILYGRSKNESQGETPDAVTGEAITYTRNWEHKDIRHEIIPDKEQPYFLGDTVGIDVKLTNLLDQPCSRDFFYMCQLPDGMVLNRPLYPVDFQPGEVKTITLGDPIFLHFLGIFRVVIVVGEPEKQLIEKGKATQPLQFISLFAGYSRDREGYRMQLQMLDLTKRIGRLNLLLIILTVALIIFTVITFVYSN